MLCLLYKSNAWKLVGICERKIIFLSLLPHPPPRMSSDPITLLISNWNVRVVWVNIYGDIRNQFKCYSRHSRTLVRCWDLYRARPTVEKINTTFPTYVFVSCSSLKTTWLIPTAHISCWCNAYFKLRGFIFKHFFLRHWTFRSNITSYHFWFQCSLPLEMEKQVCQLCRVASWEYGDPASSMYQRFSSVEFFISVHCTNSQTASCRE